MNDMTIQIEAATLVEQVVIKGDLSRLSEAERIAYYSTVCKSVGLNAASRPFDYLTLNGKLVLYARKDCTDQLRTIHKVSVVDLAETERDGVFIVTCKVQNAEGRTDCAKGAVTIQGLQGDALANALMKAETKAKRRATLSICGLGFLDETEIETISAEAREPVRAKALPKKDAKPVYVKLQAEIDGAQSRELLREWGERNAERIRLLPADWQDTLRMRYQEHLLDLQNREAQHDANGVVWEEDGERPATEADNDDGMDIPAMLDRRPTVLKGLKAQLLADITNLASARDCLHWSLASSTVADRLPKADRDEIADALRTHQQALLNGGGHVQH